MFNLHNIELIYNSNTNFSGFNSLKDLIPIDFNEIAEKKVKMGTEKWGQATLILLKI